MNSLNKKERAWELDLLRGIALLLMIIFHVVFDLRDIYSYPVYYDRGIFYYVGKVSAILFMLISGISCSFSRSNVKRGIRVLLIAMVITLATYLFDPGLIIKFGILHFLGISMILFPLFNGLNKYFIFIIATLIIIVGNFFSTLTVPFEYLFPIGLMSSSFTSSDYYPLLPWFGVFLYGVAFSKIIYREKKSVFNFKVKDNPLLFMGRHTLAVYLIHQPLILLILNLIFKK